MNPIVHVLCRSRVSETVRVAYLHVVVQQDVAGGQIAVHHDRLLLAPWEWADQRGAPCRRLWGVQVTGTNKRCLSYGVLRLTIKRLVCSCEFSFPQPWSRVAKRPEIQVCLFQRVSEQWQLLGKVRVKRCSLVSETEG